MYYGSWELNELYYWVMTGNNVQFIANRMEGHKYAWPTHAFSDFLLEYMKDK